MGLFAAILVGFIATAITKVLTSAATAGDRADDAQSRKDAAEASAKQALASANLTKTQTIADIGDIRTQGKDFLKGQRATMGFSGVDITKGSALDIRNETVAKIEADVGRRQTQGNIDYNAFMTDYVNYTAAAEVEDTSWGSNFLSGL